MTKNSRIVVVDFSGTLIKPFVVEEANKRRYEKLGLTLPSEQERKRAHGTKEHYDPLREFIGQKFGIKQDMQIQYLQNKGREIALSGKEVETIIMTDLFRDAMYLVATEQRSNIFNDGMLDALKAIQSQGYQLAIVSGMRTDIITGLLAISNCPIKFDFIYGQDPVLSRDDNKILTRELTKRGDIVYIIGDKLADLEPAKKLGAKSIFLKGGHPTGGEESFADFTITQAKELLEIIK